MGMPIQHAFSLADQVRSGLTNIRIDANNHNIDSSKNGYLNKGG